MGYFLSGQLLKQGQETELTGEEARHILLSRRMKPGETFELQGAGEKRYLAEILAVFKKSLKVKIIEPISPPPEPSVQITLLQSFINEKALDFIFQKSTELGAYKIILFNSQNTATKLSSDVFAKKIGRWQKILWEAAKQSGRVRPPLLEYLTDFSAVQKFLAGCERFFLCDVAGKDPKSQILKLLSPSGPVGLVVGPEGGFTQEEIKKLTALPNCLPISLGAILLRAETAALSGLAILRNFLEK